MLARRLLLFAVILLMVTTISAALSPSPAPLDGDEPKASVPESQRSEVVERTIDADAEEVPTIEVAAGDVLTLTVRAEETGSVELRGLGAVKAIDPLTPVEFDVLPMEVGSYPVVLIDEERTIGTVRVTTREE